jgi:hypothetical protein
MFHFVPLGFLAIFYYRIAGAQVVPNGLLSQDLVVDHDVNAFILRRGSVTVDAGREGVGGVGGWWGGVGIRFAF